MNDYPALYVNADRSSIRWQKRYLRLLCAQYALLLFAGCITVLPADGYAREQSTGYLACVLLAGVLLLYMSVRKPQKEWYETRAVAESIKTVTWRFMMRSGAFRAEATEASARTAFKAYLDDVTHTDGTALTADLAFGPQITPGMEARRALPLPERKAVYLEQRIQDQLAWYRRKALWNRRQADYMSGACVLLYLLGLSAALYQITLGTLIVQWISEPMLIAAAGLLGWMQAKRYEELAASYALAAHEIAQIEQNLSGINTEADFDAFVAEAEMAFSREHTRWVARQKSPQD